MSSELDSLLVMTVTNEETDTDSILDSGCIFHMCPNKSWFHNYKEIEPRKVYMGDNNSQNVLGISDISIKCMMEVLGRLKL